MLVLAFRDDKHLGSRAKVQVTQEDRQPHRPLGLPRVWSRNENKGRRAMD